MIFQLFSLILSVFLLGLAFWFSLTLFAIVFVVGLVMAGTFWLRAYLIEREILNPHPGIPLEPLNEQVTVIEGDYEEMGDRES